MTSVQAWKDPEVWQHRIPSQPGSLKERPLVRAGARGPGYPQGPATLMRYCFYNKQSVSSHTPSLLRETGL